MGGTGGGLVTAPIHNPPTDERDRPGAIFWVGLLIGGGVMAFGLRGALMGLGSDSAIDVARWVVSADVLHDFLIAPIAVALGWVVGRLVPARFRAPVQAGLVASAITLAIGWPGLRGYGRHIVPDNPSVQPQNYATAVLTILAIIWGVVALWLTLRALRTRHQTPAIGI